MCRLFGLIANTPVTVQYWMNESPYPFCGWSREHSHGWGIGWHTNDGPAIIKEPQPAGESSKFAVTSETAKARIFVCHLRKATCGEHTYGNTHPFRHGQWLFAHNGTVDASHFRARLGTEHRDALAGDTDSEVFFHWLVQGMNRDGIDGLIKAIADVRQREHTALNFLLSDGQTLYSYWSQSPDARPNRPDYYQLWYATRRRNDPGQTEIVVCSERLDDGEWIPIAPSTLMEVTAELDIRSTIVQDSPTGRHTKTT